MAFFFFFFFGGGGVVWEGGGGWGGGGGRVLASQCSDPRPRISLAFCVSGAPEKEISWLKERNGRERSASWWWIVVTMNCSLGKGGEEGNRGRGREGAVIPKQQHKINHHQKGPPPPPPPPPHI